MNTPHVGHKSNFIGLSREFCFIPTWITPGKTGYYMLPAKEFKHSQKSAHRLVMKLLVGRLPDNSMVLHGCGNSLCYNPYHLYVGGAEENNRDMELHRQARAAAGQASAMVGQRGEVLMPRPIALSTEASWLNAEFRGFELEQCVHSDWLIPTTDGFQQLEPSEWSGAVVGAHRKIYHLFVGPLDKYDIIRHSCGDCLCLNPYHLYYAGQQECKLTFDFENDPGRTVSPQARAEIPGSPLSNRVLAKKHGIHEVTVSLIRLGHA